MKLHLYDVLTDPLITEKAAGEQQAIGKYAFRVHPQANKKQIRSAVEKVFNVTVTNVNTANYKGKWRRVRYQPGKTAAWKKAIVTLKKGDKIDLTSA